MPRGDGTGPTGMGSMTGRRAGYCAGYDMPGYANPISGRGFGPGPDFGRGGRGGGRGWRHWYYATGLPGWMRSGYAPGWGPPAYGPYTPPIPREQETETLKEQGEWLRDQLEAIEKRIEELEEEK